MGKEYTPFKMMGFSGFGNSPAKDDPEATHPEHHEKKDEEVKWTEASREKVAPGSSAAEEGYTWVVTMKNNKGEGTKVVYR